jgi:hypothetical protein
MGAAESKQLLHGFGSLAGLSKLNLYRALRPFASSIARNRK